MSESLEMPTFPFNDHSPVATIPAKQVVTWTRMTGQGRLLLPPIQRSLVWRNSQILNYWDSLLRGYPAGLMMVHRSRPSGSEAVAQARTSDGQTCTTTAEDFQLFDGQQRLSALLLGHGHGQLAEKLRLWVDLGTIPEPWSGLLFQLRISSSGQPFGYQASSPNQKFSLGQRRIKIEGWMHKHGLGTFDPRKAFGLVKGGDLIGSVCPFPLSEIIDQVVSSGTDYAREMLRRRLSEEYWSILDTFLAALDGALKRPILFQRIDENVLAEESEYIRFFGRLGQGGTALSQDELTYSIIKHHYPEVHDRMTQIMHGSAGRLTSEVHLVLGAIRVAKVLSKWRPDNLWEVIGRPNPNFVSRLKELPEVESAFRDLIPSTPGGRLMNVLEEIRERLVYDPERNPGGMPLMLLARMPHELIDALLLLAHLPKGESEDQLPAFTLYWLLFVSDNDKAAAQVYRQFLEARPMDLSSILPSLIDQFERDGIAHAIPLSSQLHLLREEVHNDSHRLRSWSERFTGLDTIGERPTGNSLRVLSTHGELIKRSLLWLQREQITETYPHFDPTSAEDEDLPIDLDHRIPSSIFGFHWKSRDSFICFDDPDENFRNLRGMFGNSLGNLRWLDASENRSRGNGDLEADWGRDEPAQVVEPWNHLIRKKPWDLVDVSTFQRLVETRTLELFSILLKDGGISQLRIGHREAE